MDTNYVFSNNVYKLSCDATTTRYFIQFRLIHNMVTPVFITQIEEEDHSFLSEQVHSLNLKDTTSVMIMATNTYIPQEKAPSTVTAHAHTNGNDMFPSPLYSTTSFGTSAKTWEPVTKDTTYIARTRQRNRIILLRRL